MSWKSLVCAGLLCVLASPAFAQPLLTIVPGGTNASNRLDANGNWVLKVKIQPSVVNVPVGTEIGLRETTANSALLSVTHNNTNFDTLNPGTQIFTWETLTDVDPGAGTNNKAVGLQANCPAGCTVDGATDVNATDTVVTGILDEIYAALGSVDFGTPTAANDYLTITVKGPATNTEVATRSLSVALQTLGKYGVGNVFGRISQSNASGGTTSTNFDTYGSNPAFTFTALKGDTDLDGHVNGFDTGNFLAGFSAGTGKWFNGDFTGNGIINGFDTGDFLAGFAAGPAASGSVVVPEPASLVLLALGMLAFFGRRSRS